MNNPTNHIAILCSRLDLPGGTERAICNIANLLSDQHRVTIIILDETKESFYPLKENISIQLKPFHFGVTDSGNMVTRKYAFVKHVLSLRQLIKKINPDVVISTDYVFSIGSVLAGIRKYAKLISWEPHHFYWLKKNKFWKLLFRKTYPALDAVVCLNETERKLFEEIKCKATVIPGFIPRFPSQKSTLNSKELLTVGWLIKRKGIDLIPSIAAIVFRKHPDWIWVLVGKGEELDSFENAIREKKIETHFRIIQPVDHDSLEKIYANASLYVMTSRFEGFPAVLIESMAHGVPSVSFDCPTGPSDIIKHNEDGILVEKENTIQMAEAICSIIENKEIREKMGAKALENIQRFSAENIYQMWSQLFKSI